MNDTKKKGFFYKVLKSLPSILKAVLIGGAGTAGTGAAYSLITTAFKYQQSVQDKSDKDFRDIVENLADPHIKNRIVAAINIGTYIKPKKLLGSASFGESSPGKVIYSIFFGEDRHDEAVDVLINRLSSEKNPEVLNAIVVSLLRINRSQEANEVINKILILNSRAFANNDEMSYTANPQYQSAIKIFYGFISKKKFIDDDDYKLKDFKITYKAFVSTSDIYINGFKMEGRDSEISTSRFSTIFFNTYFSDININDTDFSSSVFNKCEIKNSKIKNTVFNGVVFKNFSFEGSTLENVLFIDTDLTGVDFRNVKQLKPYYFYKSRNWEKAIFDEKTKKEIIEFMNSKNNEEEFLDNLEKSDMFGKNKIKNLLKAAI